ncbi:MAG: phosphoadenosine phosphosulfate reductase family protein [Gammaproteobacteria bacterium]
MPLLDELRSTVSGLTTPEFLRCLIEDRFPGKTMVTASLRSSSIAVLKMVSEIDPHTPVLFCRRGTPFPESREYHDTIVELLGLTNVSVTPGRESQTRTGDHEHCEEMWVESKDGPGRSFEIAHLNDSLAPFDCWISAVYHVKHPDTGRHRVDVEGRLYRVDPLAGWSRKDVRDFIEQHNLPFHKRAYRSRMALPHRDHPAATETFHV